MSAIAGIYHRDDRPVTREAVIRMLDCVPHRGPDAEMVWTSGAVGIGHRLLRTTPESVADLQPLASGDGRLILTADARVDNRDELRQDLEAHGFRLHSKTDAELILRAYERWGEECAARILGDFAFAIWDTRQRRLFCARDPIGVRPFHYYVDDRRFVWASEPKQILIDSTIAAEPNLRSIGLYLHQRTIDRDQTLYEGIQRLLPSHTLTITPDGMTRRKYWDLDPDYAISYKSDAEYAEHFRALFSEAVRCRLRSCGQIGALLSGGLDSSSIVCMTEALRREGKADGVALQTYSSVFDTLPCNERQYIDAVTAHCDVPSHVAVFEREESALRIDRALLYFDLLYDPTLFMCFPLLRSAQDSGARVCLLGLGGDELLASSFHHITDLMLRGRFSALREQLGYDSTQYGLTWRSLTWNYCVKPLIPAFLKATLRPIVRRFRGDGHPRWVVPDFVHRSGLRERLRTGIPVQKFPTRSQQHIYNLLTAGVNVSLNLTQTDRLASYHSMEFRYPFFDRRLIEFLVAIPEEQRWWMDRPKAILRRALDGIVPDGIRDRKGKTCYTPAVDWELRTRQAAAVRSLLGNLTLEKTGIIDGARVRAMFDKYLAGAATYDVFKLHEDAWAIWTIVRLELWLHTLEMVREQRRPLVNDPKESKAVKSDAPAKKPYSPPTVTKYGDVVQLTQAGGSSAADGLGQKIGGV